MSDNTTGRAGVVQDREPTSGPVTAPMPPFASMTTEPGNATSWPVVFSGSGSEYFRIWIVNLLLIIVTLTFYYPWAKVRKLRYFYGNTQVAGYALDFHGDPKRMLRGYLLVGALLMVSNMAFNVSPIAGIVAIVILAAVWPAL